MANTTRPTSASRRRDLLTREFTVIAQDPAVADAHGKILRTRVSVPAERLGPGPRGYRVNTVDYDATLGHLYEAADLGEGVENGDPFERATDDELLRNPAFHAQNVYALVMRTLARFEFALGRRVSWGFPGHQLQVAPHAFCEANAFYSRRDQGLLLGYFPSTRASRRRGHTIYSCLSHDVVVHETTHGLVDGLRRRYSDPSLPDQDAFHEGFADIVALLSVFSLPDVMRELLRHGVHQRGRARVAKGPGRGRDLVNVAAVDAAWLKNSVLFHMGEEMGQELSQQRGDALRTSVTLPVSRKLLGTVPYQEAHRRGEVLVAAVMNALVMVWEARLQDSASDGRTTTVAEINRVADVGAGAADYLLTLLIRALDYAPPIDLLFGDFLSAALTADNELVPREAARTGFRHALVTSFAAWGIQPTSSDESGFWSPPEDDRHLKDARIVYDSVHLESLQRDADEVFRFLWENRRALGLFEDAYTQVLSVRPCVRVAPDGFVLRETVAEFIQQVDVRGSELGGFMDEPPAGVPGSARVRLFGGGTLVFDEFGRLKFNVHKRIRSNRQVEKLSCLLQRGDAGGDVPLGVAEDDGARRFSDLHRVRARSSPAETTRRKGRRRGR